MTTVYLASWTLREHAELLTSDRTVEHRVTRHVDADQFAALREDPMVIDLRGVRVQTDHDRPGRTVTMEDIEVRLRRHTDGRVAISFITGLWEIHRADVLDGEPCYATKCVTDTEVLGDG